MKLSSKNLIPDSCSPHSTITYTYEMIIASMVCDKLKLKKKINVNYNIRYEKNLRTRRNTPFSQMRSGPRS